MLELLKDLWGFMRERKKFWLTPLVASPKAGSVRRVRTPGPGFFRPHTGPGLGLAGWGKGPRFCALYARRKPTWAHS